MCTAIAYVRFTPESGHVRCTSSCLLWAKSGLMHCSNYPINSSARASSVGGIARPSSLAVFRLMTVSYFGRRLHRQVGRLLALEDAIDVACRTAVLISCVRPIGDQTAGNDEETFPVDRRQLAPSRKRDDQIAERHLQTFARKKDADDHHDKVRVDVRQGIYTPERKSITVAEAAEDWIKYVELEEHERSTIEYYRSHVDLHIRPRLGAEKLSKLTTPRIQAFRDDLLAHLSRPQARKVLTSLKSLLSDARRRGNVAQNVALDVSVKSDKRGKVRLKAGVDIPTPDEVRRIVHAATGRARPVLITAIFTGLRNSELRGLRWDEVDLKKGKLHVRQRADRFGKIGKLKSEAGDRVIPLGPLVVNTLREWRVTCPKGELGLTFPNGKGKLWDHVHIVTTTLCGPLWSRQA
jgi:integrase